MQTGLGTFQNPERGGARMVHPPPPVRDVSTARRGVRDEQFPIARLAVEVPRRRRGRSRHWEPILNILMRWSFTARSSCRGFEISSICNAPVTRNNRFCSLAAESGLWRPFTIPPIHSPRDSIENQGSCRPKPSLPNRYVRFRQQDQLKVSPSVRVWGGSRMRSARRRGIIRPGR